MAPLNLAILAEMDFIGSLTGNRLPFRLLQSPEHVRFHKVDFVVTRDTWGISGPDTRSFEDRLLDCFSFTGNLYYQDAKTAAYHADRLYIHLPEKWPTKSFPEAPLVQELAWAAWLLADAARQAIRETDDANIHTLVDALLLRFRNIAELAPVPEGKEVKEITAAQTFQLKVETAALIRAAEDLMSLTRELKEMWLFGPLRSLQEGEAKAKAKINEDARAVVAIFDSLIKKGDGKQKATEEKTIDESTEAKDDDAHAGNEDDGEDHET